MKNRNAQQSRSESPLNGYEPPDYLEPVEYHNHQYWVASHLGPTERERVLRRVESLSEEAPKTAARLRSGDLKPDDLDALAEKAMQWLADANDGK